MGTSRDALSALAADLGDRIVTDNPLPPERAFALNRSCPPGSWGGAKEPWTGQRFILITGARDRRPATETTIVTDAARAFLAARDVTLSADDWATFCEIGRQAIDDAYATLQRRQRSDSNFRERFNVLVSNGAAPPAAGLAIPTARRPYARPTRGNAAAVATIIDGAVRKPQDLREVLADVEAGGARSLAAIAAELNEGEIESPRGGRWYPASVARLRNRLT